MRIDVGTTADRHRLRYMPLELQLLAAVAADLQMQCGFLQILTRQRTVDDPRDLVPGLAVNRSICGHNCTPFEYIDGGRPPSFGNRLRGLIRAWNMRAFTVLTGHDMMTEISSHEWPTKYASSRVARCSIGRLARPRSSHSWRSLMDTGSSTAGSAGIEVAKASAEASLLRRRAFIAQRHAMPMIQVDTRD